LKGAALAELHELLCREHGGVDPQLALVAPYLEGRAEGLVQVARVHLVEALPDLGKPRGLGHDDAVERHHRRRDAEPQDLLADDVEVPLEISRTRLEQGVHLATHGARLLLEARDEERRLVEEMVVERRLGDASPPRDEGDARALVTELDEHLPGAHQDLAALRRRQLH